VRVHGCTITRARALASWAARRLAVGDDLDEQGRAWLTQAQADGQAGKRNLFDPIVSMIESVPERSGGTHSIQLVLA